jgi:hypothetical protein
MKSEPESQKPEIIQNPPKTDYASKTELLDALRKLRSQMSENQEKYDKKKKLVENIDIVSRRHSSILMVFLLLLILRVSFTEENSILYIVAFSNLTTSERWMLTVLFLVILPAAYLIVFFVLKKAKLKRYRKELEICEIDLKQIYNRYGSCPVGYKYAMPDIVEEIENMIMDGRADSVKEAINLIISDKNSEKLLNYQEEISRSGKQTARATTATAFFAWRGSHWAKKSYHDQKSEK